MPSERSTTAYAILGLLTLRDWTSYELAKQVRRSLNWFWPRAERKLYDEPKRLVDDGLATSVREQAGKRGRTVYRVTDAGRAALGDWLGQPPAPPTLEFEGMVKVFFADGGSVPQLLDTLRRVGTEADERLATLAGFATSEMPFPRRLHLRALGLAFQFEHEQAVRRWARWAERQVAGWPTPDDPGDWDAAQVLERLAAGRSALDDQPGESGPATRARS